VLVLEAVEHAPTRAGGCAPSFAVSDRVELDEHEHVVGIVDAPKDALRPSRAHAPTGRSWSNIGRHVS